MKKTFSEIISESIKEYRSTFFRYFLLIVLFSLIPALVAFAFQYPLDVKISQLGQDYTFTQYFSTLIGYQFLIPLILVYIIVVLSSIFVSVCIIANVVNDKKANSFSQLFNLGRKYYLKYLGYSVVLFFYLVGLLLLLIVPGIIFSVFWSLAAYIFIKENKGINASLKSSHQLVKNRWWKTVGFLILTGLIIWVLSMVVAAVGLVFAVIVQLLKGPDVIIGLIDVLINFGSGLISIPLGIIFMKNLYNEYKTNPVTNKVSSVNKSSERNIKKKK